MWEPFVKSERTLDVSLLEFDSIVSTLPKGVEGLREHIKTLINSVDREDTLIFVTKVLESDRHMASKSSMTTTDCPDCDTTTATTTNNNNHNDSNDYNNDNTSGTTTSSAPETPTFAPNSHPNSINIAKDERPIQCAGSAREIIAVTREREGRKKEIGDGGGGVDGDGGGGKANVSKIGMEEKVGGVDKKKEEEEEIHLPPTPLVAAGGKATYSYGRRAAVSAESLPLHVIQGYTPPIVAKSLEEERLVRAGVASCHLFSNMDRNDQAIIVNALQREVYPAGTDILKQDGISSEKLFLITRGSCEVIKNGKLIHVLNEGSTFGEMEMIYNLSSCVATIRSVTKCTLYTLDQITYQHIVLTVSLQKRKKYQELLQYVKFLSFFSDYDRMQIAEGLVSKVYKQGDYIIRFGENCKWLHIIEEGEVTVIGRQSGKRCEIIKRRRGHIVGELEFLFHNLATADVIVTSKKVVTAQIKRKHFELITGPIQDQLKEYIINSGIYTHYLQEANDQVKAELSLLGKRSKRLATKEEREHTQLEHVSIHGEIIIPVKKEKIFPLEKCVQGHEENVKGTHSTTSNNINDHNNDSITNETDDKNVLEKEANSSSSLSSSGHHVLSRFPLMLLHTHFLAMIALCEDGSILLWNDMMTSLTGYSSEQVVGQHICSFLLGTKDQKAMHQALCDARRYTGDAEMFLEEKGISCRKIYTFAKIDGLTKVLIKLCILPPIVSHGKDAVEIMLAVGAEHHYNHGSKRVLDKSHVLINKVSSILRDGESSYEDRVHAISSVLSRFDTTYRLMTTCMEDVHHINIRQMIGQIIMDYGTQCVANGVSVCQRFEDIYAENVYVNSRLLPECLRYAMSNCAKHLKEAIVIITLKIEEAKKNRSEEHENSESNNNNDNENMIEFLSIEFHDNGPGFPLDFLQHFHKKIFLPEEKYSHIHYIYKCMEQQGGDIIIDSVPGNTSIRFIIPFIPIDTHHHHSQSDADDVHPPLKYPRSPLDNSLNSMDHHNHNNNNNNNNNNDDNNNDTADESKTTSESHYSVQSGKDIPMGKQTFTTLVVEDVPAHRNMLCSFLWESKHAVLPAYNLDDIEQLIDVVDILFIDPHQSIFEESNNIVDPITLLREKARRMAIVITGVDIDKESEKAYHTAGFITLKKPCNPKQARLCIRKAEEMIYQYKVEAERIVQTRETFSKNSRGAWKRGKLLGKGMFGEVYEATEILTGGKMAVKEMKVGGHDLHTEQFVNEISTMCNLQHPNIIHYFYCEENKEKGVIRVFMEYASGGNVQQLLHRKNKLDFKEYQSLLRDIVEGVIYIHSMGYVHGDLKTANILLSGEGKGKIGDFGTARRVRQDELLYQMQGSPLYMSPECMSAGDRDEDGLLIGYSFPSDVWSLGCIALEMATNRPPFSHLKNVKGPLGLMNYITELHDTPDLSPLFSGPPSIVEFVSACLNPDPSKRATVAELIHMSIFSETNDEDMKSALRALKRAQLLHVLNNFVAFQEPEDLARRRSHAYSRLLVRETEFFESSFDDKDTGHEDEKNEEEENGNNNEEGTQTNKKKKHILWEETSNFIPVDDDNARNSSNVGGNSPGEEMLPMRRSCTKSKSMTRSSRRFDEDAFFETSSSSCASSPRNEAHGGDASKKNRDDNDDGCAEEKNIFQWRTNENDWRKSLSGGASSFVMNRRSIAFLGRTIDNVGVSVNVEAFPHETQEQPASKAGQEEGKEEEEEEESHSPPHAGSLCRGALTQPFDHAHRGSASSKLSPSRQRRRGMKNMFLVEDHSSGSAERCGAGPTSPRIKTTTSSAALPPLRTRGYGSFQRQRRFAAAPQMSSPSPVTPAWAVDDHLQSAGTPSSPNYGGTKKEVASLGRELAALQHAVVEMERRLRELGPNASQETWQPYLHEPSKTVVSGGEILSRGNSSQATEEENETMNSVASIRELLGRVEKGVINLKSFIPSE